MDFKQIEAFISVAKLKSFSKAANDIFLSQPTISSHISSLEKDLNVQLFDRTSKEVNLTPAGESFLEYAIDIINIRNNAVSNISCFNNNICGRLSLLASTTPCNSIVPKLVLKFSDKYPETTFDVKELSSGNIVKNILNLNDELGIIGTYIEDDKIKTYKLLEDELVVISSKSLNLPDIIDVDTLKKQKFIMREKSSATRATMESEFKKYGINLNSLNVICEVNNIDTLIQFVNTGMGISIVSKKIFENCSNSNKLKISKIKDININRGIYLIINSKRTLTPCGKAFLKLCADEYNLKL
ncbi:selenium metabolism-associated LysR family transcriptional regulator [Haloimpatiens lingqiaonensis]|uniref:selenium metabolism-associated LysR family transcriptional regulator n=1 Tax=Haloimpatiens lingqiaonensis TaxID=1380675 RepID=UPI0010FEFAD0|nr:selenium metabolism-associated LysR family transcriptional regulator [Haloimpatiens lingqiaonensis]